MPLYEYFCHRCEKTVEVMQKFSDPPLTEHEGCGGTLEKVLSAPAFQFKGSGWYVTDYGGKSAGKEGGNGKPAKTESKSESKAEKKKESQPASKTGSS